MHGRNQTSHSHKRIQDDVTVVFRRADQTLFAEGGHEMREFFSNRSGILLPFGHRKFRSEFFYLFAKQIGSSTARKTHDFKRVDVFSYDIEALRSY